jgi:radical SAM protein with 4Fe4S-binding SPASM domain
MRSLDVTGKTTSREILSEKIPLKTPFALEIFSTSACNFKCKFCLFSLKEEQRSFVSSTKFINIDLFKKVIEDCSHFKEKIKVVRFSGMGEPLLHPNIIEMITFVKSKNICDRIELITNGSLLTNKMCLDLVESGLDKITVSILGVTQEDYKNISGNNIPISTIVYNLSYLYNYRKNLHVHCKIANIALTEEWHKNMFYTLFGNFSDTVSVEAISPLFNSVDYKFLNKTEETNQFFKSTIVSSVCSEPFFTCILFPDGKVSPCHSFTIPEFLGDCNKESIVDIWNGDIFNAFRKRQLNGVRNEHCFKCKEMENRLLEEDTLEEYKQELLDKFFKQY